MSTGPQGERGKWPGDQDAREEIEEQEDERLRSLA
jgi:hypothetical protein